MPIRIIDKARDREEASVKDKKKKSKLKELEGDVESSTAAYKMLVGGQAKLDKNKNNKIDAQDFKILKAEKAKGRGQGLQDEKMKPGKPMKAALGAIALGLGAKKMMDKKGKKMPMGMGAAAAIAAKKKEILGKKRGGGIRKDPTKPISSVKPLGKLGGAGSMKVKKAHQFLGKMSDSKLKEMVKKGKNPDLGDIKESSRMSSMEAKSFLERRKKLGRPASLGKLGKAGRIGLLGAALGLAGAGAAKVGQTIGRKMSEKKNKKMGGGMMQRPGYNVGGSVTVKTKLGRNKPTKMY